MRPARFITLGKRHYLVDNENYVYHRLSVQNGVTRWRCKLYNKERCFASARTARKAEGTSGEEEVILSTGQHNHLASISEVTSMFVEEEALREAVGNNSIKPRQVLVKVANKLNAAGAMMRRSEAAFLKSLHRQRQRKGGYPPVPHDFSALIERLPPAMELTTDGAAFLLSKENDSLIFISESGRRILGAAKTWFADGTFKSAPVPFRQIYVVMGKMASGKAIPAAFALLPAKDAGHYEHLWQVIKVAVRGCQPETLIVDHELASILSFRSIFPESSVATCHFHFRKAVSDQLLARGCRNVIGQIPACLKVSQLMVAMAYVPPEDICGIWTKITELFAKEMESADDVDDADLAAFEDYMLYFERTYVGKVLATRGGRRAKPTFEPALWCQYHRMMTGADTTNNNSEAFNSAWNALISRNASVWTVIQRLAEEEGLARQRWLEQLSCTAPSGDGSGQGGSARNKTQKDRRARLANICSSYTSMEDKKIYLDLLIAALF